MRPHFRPRALGGPHRHGIVLAEFAFVTRMSARAEHERRRIDALEAVGGEVFLEFARSVQTPLYPLPAALERVFARYDEREYGIGFEPLETFRPDYVCFPLGEEIAGKPARRLFGLQRSVAILAMQRAERRIKGHIGAAVRALDHRRAALLLLIVSLLHKGLPSLHAAFAPQDESLDFGSALGAELGACLHSRTALGTGVFEGQPHRTWDRSF